MEGFIVKLSSIRSLFLFVSLCITFFLRFNLLNEDNGMISKVLRRLYLKSTLLILSFVISLISIITYVIINDKAKMVTEIILLILIIVDLFVNILNIKLQRNRLE